MSDLLKKRLDVEVPPRCSQHQCVKSAVVSATDKWRRCIVCANYHKKLGSAICSECLGTENLDKFKVDPLVENEPWYRYE